MRRLAAAALLSLSAPVMADDFDFAASISQADFRAIAEDLSASLGYKALGPAEAGGITGFSIGAFAAYAPTESPEAWRNATLGNKVDATGMVGLIASKGLPFDIDVGALYAEVPNTEARLTGFELRYALLAGSAVSPTLALRASYTKLGGVDDFDYETQGLDLSISKGFLVAAPYAGIGLVKSTMTLKGIAVVGGDQEEEVEDTRLFAGVRLSLLPLLAITPEFERIGKVSSYNLRLGLSF
jgi:hypothetical protein